MKLLISFLFASLVFSASASHSDVLTQDKNAPQTTAIYPGPGKGTKRSNKRINKKRKRKCSKWGRKNFAG